MKISNKKVYVIIIIGILVGVGMGIYIYQGLSNMTHIVPIYLTVNKKEVEMGENVVIYVKIGTTEYPFEISNENTHNGGLGIYRIPDNISPEQVLSNKTLRDELIHRSSMQSGHLPFVINNKKKVFKFEWNCTIPAYNTYYHALAGYYFVYIDAYAIPYGNIIPQFIINDNSIFYLKGISAELNDSKLIINSTRPLDFQGKIEITKSNFTTHYTKYIEFNYTGMGLSIDLDKENIEVSQADIILITPYGNYWVGEYVHSKGK